MKRYPSLIAASMMLEAIALFQTQAAANTWNNFTANFLWSTNPADQNWTSPTAWVNGDDAIFGATGAGAVYLSTPVSAHNLTLNSAGYSINAFAGGNSKMGYASAMSWIMLAIILVLTLLTFRGSAAFVFYEGERS